MRSFKNAFLIETLMITAVLGVLTALAGCTQLLKVAEKPAPRVMKIIEKSEGFAVMEGEKKVLFYQHRPTKLSDHVLVNEDSQTSQTLFNLLKVFDEKSRPNYIHPLYGLDGEILTEDYALTDHLDHPHHGIFWAWHQVLVGNKKMGDSWDLKDFSWDVYNVETSTDSESATLKAYVYWKSPAWTDDKGQQKPFVKETTIIRIYRASGDIRKIDLQISLLALEDGVRIGGSDNEKGYGGFSPRIKMPKGLVFTGTNGAVKPKNLAVEAGPWMDFSGNFRGDGKVSGLAVLCHKSIPGYPRPWILRRKGSMQNAVYPGRHPVTLSREKPLVLRYRLIVHRGNARQVNLDKLQAQYNAEGPF